MRLKRGALRPPTGSSVRGILVRRVSPLPYSPWRQYGYSLCICGMYAVIGSYQREYDPSLQGII